jgi:hypothetical protein
VCVCVSPSVKHAAFIAYYRIGPESAWPADSSVLVM